MNVLNRYRGKRIHMCTTIERNPKERFQDRIMHHACRRNTCYMDSVRTDRWATLLFIMEVLARGVQIDAQKG